MTTQSGPIIEHDEHEAPPEMVESPTTTTTIAEPVEETPQQKTSLKASAALVPVGAHGVQATTLAGQIDYAQTMARAQSALPKHLRGNVGDCLALIDIASRANLSPYMLANKTYIQNDRLCFESQAFHALVQGSGLLKGELEVEWKGEGDTLVCVVTGYLKSDPTKAKVHESEPLAKAHPGRTNKDGKTFVRGSPLWDKKPKVQLFYDTGRDWVRMYCPRAVLGMYTVEEMQEYPDGVNGAITTGTVSPDLHKRLTAGRAEHEEGFKPGHTESELAQVAAGDREIIKPEPTTGGRAARRQARQQAAAKPTPAKAAPTPKAKTSKAAAKIDTAKAAPAAKGPKEPTTSAEYIAYATAWIAKVADRDDAWARWDGDRELRDSCKVPVKDRHILQGEITDRFKEAE